LPFLIHNTTLQNSNGTKILSKLMKNLSIINKTKHPTKGEKKIWNAKTKVLTSKKKSSKEGGLLGESSTPTTPPNQFEKNIRFKRKGGTCEQTHRLNKPSIYNNSTPQNKRSCACCNITDIFCL
jgi:hypothetical protein